MPYTVRSAPSYTVTEQATVSAQRTHAHTPLAKLSVVLRAAHAQSTRVGVDACCVVETFDIFAEISRKIVVVHTADVVALETHVHLQPTHTHTHTHTRSCRAAAVSQTRRALLSMYSITHHRFLFLSLLQHSLYILLNGTCNTLYLLTYLLTYL